VDWKAFTSDEELCGTEAAIPARIALTFRQWSFELIFFAAVHRLFVVSRPGMFHCHQSGLTSSTRQFWPANRA
jgi:hypothetical protein